MGQFVPNPNFPAEILHGPILAAQLNILAQEGLAIARRLVPVATGALRDSLHVESNPDGVGTRVVAGTDHWLFVEFGTSEEAPQPFLRPILDEIGLHR